MSANISSVFLKIQHVDISDSGMYFCGFYIDGHTEINVKHLNVKGKAELLVSILLKRPFQHTEI